MTALQPWRKMTYEEWEAYNDEVCEIEPNNMIPLKAAIDKMRAQLLLDKSDSTLRKYHVRDYKDGLNIKQQGKKYYCNKDRLDFIDFTRYHAVKRHRLAILLAPLFAAAG